MQNNIFIKMKIRDSTMTHQCHVAAGYISKYTTQDIFLMLGLLCQLI